MGIFNFHKFYLAFLKIKKKSVASRFYSKSQVFK